MRRLRTPLVVAALVLAAGAAQAVAAPPRPPEPLAVWPLGDSITYGSTDPTLGIPGGYRGALDAELQAVVGDHLFVGSTTANSTAALDARGQAHHDGHPAYRVDQVSLGLTARTGAAGTGRWLARLAAAPQVVVIHLGTNDIGQRYDPGVRYPTRDGKADMAIPAQRALFVRHLTARLRALLDKLDRRVPGVRVVLATVAPTGWEVCDRVTPDYAESVRALVAELSRAGREIALADVFSALTQQVQGTCRILPGMLARDGIHPSALGYAVMSRTLALSVAAVSR